MAAACCRTQSGTISGTITRTALDISWDNYRDRISRTISSKLNLRLKVGQITRTRDAELSRHYVRVCVRPWCPAGVRQRTGDIRHGVMVFNLVSRLVRRQQRSRNHRNVRQAARQRAQSRQRWLNRKCASIFMQPCAAARAHRKQARDVQLHDAAAKVRAPPRQPGNPFLDAKKKSP